MSRQGASRNLTLTEELEKLEQSITLTLQEIDSNFSKAHRIVTGSILPIVEQYAKHSSDVWEGSKFWKQFFEASANVSLSGYEEATLEDTDATQTDTTSSALETPSGQDDTASGADLRGADDDGDNSFTIDSPTQITGVQSTPRLPPSTAKGSRAANSTTKGKAAASFRSPSPRKYTGSNPLALSTDSQDEPSTPRPRASTLNPQSSPFEPESAFQPSGRRQQNDNHDPVMHRGVLDKNYRIQATPHTQRRTVKPTPVPASKTRPWDDSPESSPAVAAPQLRSDLFSPSRRAPAPRTPGVSILTPARGRNYRPAAAPTTSTGRQLFSPEDKNFLASISNDNNTRASHIFSEEGDSDDDDEMDMMSPPKTMQFHVPQSRLLQTPAREASRRIVEDLLLTAGADGTEEIDFEDGEEGEEEEASPSMVRRAHNVDELTF